MRELLNLIIIGFLCFGVTSCVTLKPYEKIYVNDSEMQMESDSGEDFQSYVESIREGAIPAGTSKSSGGCGCN